MSSDEGSETEEVETFPEKPDGNEEVINSEAVQSTT
jgi:hypothetical protein